MTSRREFIGAIAAALVVKPVAPTPVVAESPLGLLAAGRVIPDIDPAFAWLEQPVAPFTTLMMYKLREPHEVSPALLKLIHAPEGLVQVWGPIDVEDDAVDFCDDNEDGEHTEDCSHND